MKILLTGGTGYIGSHAAVVLVDAGHQVVLLDNLSNSQVAVLDRLERILAHRVPFVEADIRDTDTMIRTMRDHGIDAVMHFAGLKAVGESVKDPINYYANNVQGTISLLQAMDACNVRTMVFSSSATVYGDPQYLPLDEHHPTSATNPYGRSKLHIEEILSDVAQSNDKWNFVCLRYFNPVGAHASGLIGERPNGIPNNLMPYIAQVAHGERPFLSVFGDDYNTPDGTGVRVYIHVVDLVDGHLAALEFAQNHSGWHAINLGTGKGSSVLEMVQAFAQASGKDVPYQIMPRRSGDVASCYAKPDKAAEVLGWTAKKSIDDMCRSTWRWQESEQSGS